MLRCPVCLSPVKPTTDNDGLLCAHCHLIYPIRDGFPIMTTKSTNPASRRPPEADALRATTLHSTMAPAPKLERLIPRLRGRRIAVLGDLMLDRYVWGNATRLSPEAAVPVVDFVSETSCLGGAGNVAANIAALGGRVTPFGVTGDDEAGHALRAELASKGMTDKGILADAKRVTTLKTRIIARHQQVVRVDRERRDPLGKPGSRRRSSPASRQSCRESMPW